MAKSKPKAPQVRKPEAPPVAELGRQSGQSGQSGASRFFYIAKPAASEKQAGLGVEDEHGAIDNTHPTVKPVRLMEYLCRLITPPGGTVLDDAFAGSGTTGVGALAGGFNFIGIEQDPTNAKIARKRIATAFPGATDENKKKK